MSANRNVIHQMKFFAKKHPILVLTGPRYSGRMTLLKNPFSAYCVCEFGKPR